MRITVNNIKFGRALLALMLITGLFVGLSGCSSDTGTATEDGQGTAGSFKIIGSNTVEPLSVLWAEDFMKENPDVSPLPPFINTGLEIVTQENVDHFYLRE